jgi:hypothetical protein
MLDRFRKAWTRLGDHVLTTKEINRLGAILDFSENILPWAVVLVALYMAIEIGTAFLPGGPAWLPGGR